MQLQKGKFYKLKWLIIALFLFLLYLLPNIISANMVSLFFWTKSYDQMLQYAGYSELFLLILGNVIGIFICYRFGFYNKWKSVFSIKNTIILLIFIITLLIVEWGAQTFYQYYASGILGDTQSATYNESIMPPVVYYTIINFSAPVFEEAIFRECIYRFFKNPNISFIVSCVLFAFLHTGFTTSFWVYIIMAMMFTAVYHRRRVLLDSIIVHLGYNVLITPVFKLLFHLFGFY